MNNTRLTQEEINTSSKYQKIFRIIDKVQDKVYPIPEQWRIDAWIGAYDRIGQYWIDTIPFCVRPLTRAEYRFCKERSAKDSIIFDELICQKAVIWPSDFDFSNPGLKAGIPNQLSHEILELSGFTKKSREDMFFYWQEQCYEQEMRRDILIQLVFPQLTFDILENLSQDDYYRYLASAEFRIRTQLLTSVNPEFSPDELVDLFLCPKAYLEQRMDKARANIENINFGTPTGAQQDQQDHPAMRIVGQRSRQQ